MTDSTPQRESLRSLPLVCLGYHPWSDMWKRNQSMSAELARQGLVERLVFLNPEVSLVTSPGQVIRDCRTVRRYSWTQVIPRRPEPRVTVMTPIHLVPLRGSLAPCGWLDRRLIHAAVRRALGGARRYVLLVNTIRAETQELVELLWDDARLRVFDWSDDFSRFAREPRTAATIARTTDRLIAGADCVLTVNEHLTTRARARHDRVHTIINATNMRPLPADHRPSPAVRALAETCAGPVIGYAGYINQHRIDLELVGALAERHPEWTILFVGPIQDEFRRRFPALPNIRFHPPVPYGELQEYLALFDVCMIPHLDNPHTAGNNPLKLYDYLTTGRPVVATRVHGMEGFEDVVAVTDDRAGFIAAVEAALVSDPPPAAARRQARAGEHHWSIRARAAAAVLDAALAAAGRAGDHATLPGAAEGGTSVGGATAPRRATGS